MSRYFDKSFAQILEESASNAPTPGGGSVAAMAGTFGAAMVSMVANLTKGEKFADVHDEIDAILAEISQVMVELEKQVDDDMSVFGAFMDALKMPKSNDEEKVKRTKALQDAYKKATLSPLEIADTCIKANELALRLAPIGNKSAISDVGVGAIIADASLKGVLLAVDINLPGIKDSDFVEKAAARRDAQIEKSEKLMNEAVKIVKGRL
ncbi:cyclodeaminase/cyclohydrolase family protein [Clostridia bacterium]|nr:cyclodeaminase/cyclohydrolase family protein [Clostridia bacterium]